MSDKKEEPEDSLSQDIITRTKAKDFLEKLFKAINDYLDNKAEFDKYAKHNKAK